MKLKDALGKIDLFDYDDEYEIFLDEYLINEGLIKSWPIDKTISLIKSNGFECDKTDNIFHVLTDQSKIEKLIKLSNNLGWFASYMYLMNNEVIFDKGKFNIDDLDEYDFDSILIRFEAKYDIKIEDIPKYLYHATTREKALKILSFGLSPKTNSIISTHPERVYLANTSNAAETMVRNNPNAWKKSRDGRFCVLQINTNMIPRYFQIYQDPNYKKNGFFTLNNIPPKAIELEKSFDIKI